MKKTIRTLACLVFILSVVCCVLTACKPKPFTITFDVDGDVYDTRSTAGNEELTLPANPLKQGFIFDGWFFDKDEWQNRLTAETYLETELTEDVTVYAKWLNGYTITFDVDGASYSQVATAGNEVIALPANPRKLGYAFDGWYFDNETWENAFTADSYAAGVPSGDVRVYAKWIKDSSDDLVFESDTERTCIVGVKSNNINMDNFVMPDSVTSIRSEAFTSTDWYNRQPDGAVYIKDWLYKYKGNMPANTQITVKDGTANIANSAFANCTGLTGVTIPESVTSIGDRAFYGCSGLTSVALPANIDKISDYMFYNCTGLSGITIPAGVKSIGDSAFRRCSGLTSVTIPGNVTTVGDYAFFECSGLTTATIDAGVASIGKSAFRACPVLANVSINDSVTNIGESAFDGTSWNGTQSSGLVYLGKVLYKYNGTMPANTQIAVQDGTRGIAEYAFQGCTNLTGITLPETVASIGKNAFAGCSGLTSITIPASVKNIDADAFKGSGVTNIYYTGDVAGWCQITGLGNLTGTGRTLYISGSKVEGEINIPESVTSIADSAFYGCTGLTRVVMSNNVTSIGNSAFTGCTGLQSIFLSNSLKSIGNSAFYGCSYLSGLTLPDSLTDIGSYAFYTCGRVSVSLPEGLKTIGNNAFEYCNAMTNVTLPNSLVSLGDGAFRSSGVTVITIPDGFTAIGANAFQNCTGLTTANIPVSAISAIPKANLQTVVVTSGEALGTSAFQGSTMLSSVTLPNTLTTIGANAFYGCSKLESITIPASVTTIGTNAFKVTESTTTVILKKVYYDGDIAGWCKLTGLKNLLKDGREIYIKSGKRYTLLTDFVTITANQLKGVTVLVDSIFAGFEKLISVELPAGLVSIGNKAFHDCTALTKVIIPEGVTTIGTEAFYHCNKLTEIELPNSVTTIGTGAFGACYGLQSITLPSSITSVGSAVFDNCSALKSITIPVGVPQISGATFNGCISLEEVTIPTTVTKLESLAFFGTSLKTIHYEGTKAQWESITKGKVWVTNPDKVEVDCTDGKINERPQEPTPEEE